MPSHYETLGIAKTASDAEIKSAFRKLAMQYHPDKNPGNTAAEKKFKEINEAYENLKDPQKRATYDAQQANPFSRGASGATWDDISRRRQYGGLDEDMFADLLRRAQSQQRYQQQQNQRNKDTILKYTITFEESFTGKEVELRYSTSRSSNKTVKINVPRSVQDGAKIRYGGLGDDLYPNAPAGDLYVVITVLPDNRFYRIGDNVLTSISIDFIDAMLGVHKRIPCIDGSEINLRIHAGTKPKANIRIPEKGFWTSSGRRGDMTVEVNMEQPVLNAAQLELLAKIKNL